MTQTLAGATDLGLGTGFQGSARIMTLGGGKVSCSAYAVANSGLRDRLKTGQL